MRWEIRGADASSGDDRLMVIEGSSADEVEAKARYAGMLVSSATPVATGPVVEYALPDQQKAALPAPLGMAAPPDYRDIHLAAGTLRILGTILATAGAIVIVLNGWTLLTDLNVVIANVPAAFGWLISLVIGLSILTAGVLMRLLASVALAIRDIARSSATNLARTAEATGTPFRS